MPAVKRMSEAPADQRLERRLVHRARGGDREAFDTLVRQHFAEVYGLLFRMVGNHEDAEDLAQETFVRAFRSLSFFREEGRLAAWLGRIALHLARDQHRRRARGPFVPGLDSSELETSGNEPEPARELSRRELVQRVGEAVAELPHNLRAALVLRVLEGRDYDEVAAATGMKPGTVRTQVMKARRLLMRTLRPWIERNES